MRQFPQGHFSVKADATDLRKCIQTSKNGEWFGDVDHGDRKLAEKRQLFDKRYFLFL